MIDAAHSKDEQLASTFNPIFEAILDIHTHWWRPEGPTKPTLGQYDEGTQKEPLTSYPPECSTFLPALRRTWRIVQQRSLEMHFRLSVVALLLFGMPAAGAEIRRTGVNAFGQAIITIDGEMTAEDTSAFESITATTPQAIVVLNSPGGSLSAGIGIGNHIRARGFSTAVGPTALCASACALAWLGGVPRMGHPTSRIGFHAAFTVTDGRAIERGVANALVGSYASKLGLSDRAIAFMTVASPEAMTWLTDANSAAAEIPAVFSSSDQHSKIAPSAQLAPAGSPKPKSYPDSARFSIQVATAPSWEAASSIVRAYQRQLHSIVGSFKPLILEVANVNGSYYRVRFGSEPREVATLACARLLEAGTNCFIVLVSRQ